MKSNITTKELIKKTDISTATLFKSSLLYQTKEFFDNSTLHGVRYIAESGRPFGEKFMWFCFTSIGAVAALIIIFSLWEKFQTNPTITGLDTDFHNQKVVFPVVAVCPINPYSEELVKKYAFSKLGNYEEDSVKFEPFLEVLTGLSYDKFGELYATAMNFSQDWNGIKGSSLRSHAFQVASLCDDIFSKCIYKDEEISCCINFQPIYMEYGFCYAFNTRFKDNADYDEQNKVINDMFETDKKWALNVQLKVKSDVFIHSYEETTGWDYRPQFTWDINEAISVLISMKQTYTTDDARQLSIGQRKCIFPSETKLKFYNEEYTFSGCMRECRMRKSIRFCKCVPPFYRPSTSYASCDIDQVKCLANYASNITNIKGCRDCELSCHNTVYDIEKITKISVTDPSAEPTLQPTITIEYLTWPIVRFKREVLFGWVDLLVSFGGIAGLFLGFSLLSGVEIIYYFTMRAWCMLYKNREDLHEIEYEKIQRPPTRYNLSLKPDMKKSTRSKSLPPVINVRMVSPVKNNDFEHGVKENNFNLPSNYVKKSQINHNYLKPNFRLGKIASNDIYTNKNFRSSSVDNFFYMP